MQIEEHVPIHVDEILSYGGEEARRIFSVFEDDRGTYILNSNDLCMIEYLSELIDSGLDSLKIEGRMKSSYYVATVVQAYRQELDRYEIAGDNYI